MTSSEKGHDDHRIMSQNMRIMFALWTACAFASLALPGMSGFVSELMVFAGFVTDEAYTLPFRVVMAGFAAVGVILTPIYLLSMLREIFVSPNTVRIINSVNCSNFKSTNGNIKFRKNTQRAFY